MIKRFITPSSFGGDSSDHILLFDWKESGKDIFVQGGRSGAVFSKSGGYTTAFFEAFPNRPKCFIRGEGTTLEEAEKKCYDKWQKIINCPGHEMDRLDRTDGYAYCKHCDYSATVFEPLTKCRICKKPTSYSRDYKGRYYCKKHRQYKPKNPDPNAWENKYDLDPSEKLPRKLKKKYKEAFLFDLYYRKQVKADKAKLKKGWFRLNAHGFQISPISYKGVKNYIRTVLMTKCHYLRYLKKKSNGAKRIPHL
jgi:hypothetical protein